MIFLRALATRICRGVALFAASRSLRVTFQAGANRCSTQVLEAIRQGATVRVVHGVFQVSCRGVSVPLPARGLWGAVCVANVLTAGWSLSRHDDDSWILTIPDGPRFRLSTASIASDLGVLYQRFWNGGEYRSLDVRDAVVIDIGANIGDSAIYFVLRGAKRVFACEPFQRTCQQARENVAFNGLEDRVCVCDVGVGARSERRVVSYDPLNSWGLSTTPLATGERPDTASIGEAVRILSLPDLFALCPHQPSDRLICKMDCEGAEFEVFSDVMSLAATLRALDTMLVEYHGEDPGSILRPLELAGFDVTVDPDRRIPHCGLIWATRGRSEVHRDPEMAGVVALTPDPLSVGASPSV